MTTCAHCGDLINAGLFCDYCQEIRDEQEITRLNGDDFFEDDDFMDDEDDIYD